jgi:hypothetical protein
MTQPRAGRVAFRPAQPRQYSGGAHNHHHHRHATRVQVDAPPLPAPWLSAARARLSRAPLTPLSHRTNSEQRPTRDVSQSAAAPFRSQRPRNGESVGHRHPHCEPCSVAAADGADQRPYPAPNATRNLRPSAPASRADPATAGPIECHSTPDRDQRAGEWQVPRRRSRDAAQRRVQYRAPDRGVGPR